MNIRRKVIIWIGLVMLLLIALFPQWRYADGARAGFHPVFPLPPVLPDSLQHGTAQQEYLEIKMIPLSIYQIELKMKLTEEEMRKPYIDIRRMLSSGGILFLGVVVAVIMLGDGKRTQHFDKQS